MKFAFTFLNIRFVLNLLIVLMIIQSVLMLGTKSYKLFFKSDEIDVVKIDVPWNQPINTVTLMFNKDILQRDSKLLGELNESIFIHDLIKRTIFTILILLILIQLRRLIITIRGKTFFESRNLSSIQNISVLVGTWVCFSFLLYHALWLFISEELVIESINFISLKESFFTSLLISIDFKLLFVSLILYIISISFKEGYQLKEQTELTI